MAYVYKHTRLDKNEIFYIGIGCDKYFFRPKDKKRRNIYWQNIVNITDWTYEVIFIDDDVDIVKEKEIELIKLYGITTDGGTLCNMTLGGEGTLGLSPKNIKKCFGLSPTGEIKEFSSLMEAARFIGSETFAPNICHICKGKHNFCKGWRFGYTEKDLYKTIISTRGKIKNKSNGLSVIIWGKSPSGEIKKFENAYRAAEYINGHHTLVRKVLKGKSLHTKHWIFSYSEII